MGTAAVKIKLMPSSPEAEIKKIEKTVEKILKENQAKSLRFEIQPIAFGLKALIVLFGWPEEKPLEELEEALRHAENINSVEVIDIRRAIG